MEHTDIQNHSDLNTAFSEQDLIFDSGYVSSHQTVTPCHGMPRISLLCLVEVGATNRATVVENEKHKNEIKVSAYKCTFDNIAYSVFLVLGLFSF